MRPLRLALAALLVAGIATLATPATPASAHAYLAASAPADGAVLEHAPELLTLTFTEHVELSASHVDIVDGNGRRYAPTSITLRTKSGDPVDGDTEEPEDVVVGLPALPPDVYHVRWRTLSSDDLHVTSGNLVIGVQRTVRAAARPAGPGGPAPAEATLRGVGLLGLSLLLGGAVLALLAGAANLRRRLLRAATAGGVVALVAASALLAAQVAAGAGEWGPLLLSQAGSPRWLGYALSLAALTAATVTARHDLRRGLMVGAPAAVATAVCAALLGHAAGASVTTIAATAVHVLAAGGWAGSLLAVVLLLTPLPRRTRVARQEVAPLLRSFAVVASTCVTLLVVSGLWLTGVQIATVDALLTTPYGWLLIAKLLLAAVAGGLGLRTARRLRTRSGEPVVPIRTLLAEAGSLVLVVALAAALASAGVARGPRFDAAPRTVPEVSGQAADLVDAVAIRPNRPGRNVVTITVNDTRRPALAPVGGVSVVLRGPDGTQAVHPVTRGSDGVWSVAVDDIRTAGRWQVSVTVLRPGLAAVTDAHAWAVAGGAPPVISAAPLRPATTALAVVLLAAVIAGAVVSRLRRRRAYASGGDIAHEPDGSARGGSTTCAERTAGAASDPVEMLMNR
jgi:copper transport protein